MNHINKAAIISILIVLIFLSGCATSPAKISEDPGHYDGKTVRLRGEVGKVFWIPLTDISIFLLKGKEANVPVITLSDRTEGEKTSVRGEVWAFPEDGMNIGSMKAVDAVEDFLIDNDIIERAKATEVSALILTAARKLSEGLGNIWFLMER